MDKNSIKLQAEKELKEEEFRKAVDLMKEKLKKQKWYHLVFPWKIVIIRRDD